ncbi:hypothetical protein LT012_19875, partial [Vibrio cholerae]|uniref:hypothetical protein n=1 Tax=Vibrio cholerae TaxID=666 RepID=UPI001E347DF3
KYHPKDNGAVLHKTGTALAGKSVLPAQVMGQGKRARLGVQRAHHWYAKVNLRQRAYWVGYLYRVGIKKVAIR